MLPNTLVMVRLTWTNSANWIFLGGIAEAF